MISGKKAISIWISYVLLTALVVVTGFAVLNWTRDQTQQTVDDIVERGESLTLCKFAAVDVKNLCQDTQTLNMDVTNTQDVKVVEVWASMFDIYDRPQSSSRNITILPQATKNIKILKQGLLKQVEIAPVVVKDSLRVKCLSKRITFESVPVCK